MKIQLVIPTHARPARQLTLMALPPELRRETIVVTSNSEDMRAIQANYGHSTVMVAKGTRCIAEKRHWIMKNIKADVVFMMDDDLVFFRRCSSKYSYWDSGQYRVTEEGVQRSVTLMQKAEPKDWLQAYAQLQHKAEEGYAGVALSFRMHNDKIKGTWAYNYRSMYAFGINRAVYLQQKLNFAEVVCREDFNITLRLLRAGFKNAVYMNLMSSEVAGFNSEGGASTTRTIDQSNEQAELLARLHPGLVRVVQRNYGSSTIPRKEVVVAWKKAAEEGSHVR